MLGFAALASGASWSGNERNRLFLNRGGNQFENVSGVSALDDIGDGRVFAVLDYDRDGWQDVALINNNSPAFALYRNSLKNRLGVDHGYIAFRFVGGNHEAAASERWSNRDGYGVQLTLQSGDLNLHRELRCGEGLSAQNSATLMVGVGNHANAEKITLRWPSGHVQISESPIHCGQLVTVYENPADSPTGQPFVAESYEEELPARSDPEFVPPREQLKLVDNGHGPDALRMYTTTATWCPNCKALLPHLEYLRSVFGDAELTMYGVPIDPEDNAEELEAYVNRYEPAYEVLADLTKVEVDAVQRILRTNLYQDGLPSTIVTDAKGNVLSTTWGAPSVSELRRLRFHSDLRNE